MNKEFRVWDSLCKEMNLVEIINYEDSKIYPFCKEGFKRIMHFDEAVLMQLAYYDDNVVIYDKDILRDSNSGKLGVVVYSYKHCVWKVITQTKDELLFDWLDCDVVGNAYENPELLKGIW
ncbi:YopX family protein [Streptococcus equi]|uniref:YopX family protein n=1 Tax=Streptococcus equi TaxID=1336 RepID=UPI0006587C05|nr:YopX family protein [Streptococcus equi]CRR16184.1 phage protein [Streptococcus equi subsp. equi]